ncbi:FecR domain-containing protein [Thermodesulfobacteriota bacterium]
MTDKLFDKLLKEIREEEIPAEQVTAAKERVLEKLTGSASMACAEIQPQLKDYAAGNLMDSRRLLIDDHLSRCLECRHELAEVKGKKKVVAMPRKRSFQTGWMRWAAAAAVIIMAVYLGRGHFDSWMAPSGASARIVSLSGDLYRLPQENLPLGSVIQKGDVVRTVRGGHAVLELNDGSRIELNERTELAVNTAWSGSTIRLNRGDIMVQAAEQRRGSLRVVTHDSIASVKGTIFSVSSGTAGSLVSVVEGSVAVTHFGLNEVLTRGQQASTSDTLKKVAINDAIAWSKDAEKYYTLLSEFIRIEKELADIPGPALRYEASLLQYIPAGTQSYFAIPNLDNRIKQALELVEQYSHENIALQEWWTSGEGKMLKKVLERAQTFSQLLGEEVLFLMVKYPAGSDGKIPLLLAHVMPGSEPDLCEALDNIFENNSEVSYEIFENLLLVSNRKSHLDGIIPLLGNGASSPFAREVDNYYMKGVSCLLGIDASELVTKFRHSVPSQVIGLSNVQYLFFEFGSGGGTDTIQTTLSFQGPRAGVMSWLAPPASAGSIEYISAEALTAVSASTRDPRELFDELMKIIAQDSEFITNLEKFESTVGISLGDDIASSLGTDFTLAIERLSIPVPGCVGIFEVIRPDTLDETIHHLVDTYNKWLPPEKAKSRLFHTSEIINGRTWNSLRTWLSLFTLYWTYDRGYLVVSTDRGLADRAISIRDSGPKLIHSSGFKQRLPVNTGLHNSGLFWFNNNGVLSEVASMIQNPVISELIDSTESSLVMVNVEMEKIRIASHSRVRLSSIFLSTLLTHTPGR